MAEFECDRYPYLRVVGVNGRFDGGRLVTDDAREMRLLAETASSGVVRVDAGAADALPEEVDPERVARHQGRGWYRFDGEGDDGRAYRRDDVERMDGVLVIDDEGDQHDDVDDPEVDVE